MGGPGLRCAISQAAPLSQATRSLLERVRPLVGDVCSLGVCSWTLCIVWATAMASTPPCVSAAGISCVSCSVAVSVAWSLSGDGDRPAGRMLSYSLQRCGGVLACARVILLCACTCANVTVVCDPACAIYLPCCICSLRLGESAACTCGLLVHFLQRRGSTPLRSSPVHHGLCFGRPRLFLSRVKSTVQEWRSSSFSLLRMAPVVGTLSVFRSRFPLHCVTSGVPAFPRSVSTTDPPSGTSSYCLSMSTSGRPGLPADEGVRQGRHAGVPRFTKPAGGDKRGAGSPSKLCRGRCSGRVR